MRRNKFKQLIIKIIYLLLLLDLTLSFNLIPFFHFSINHLTFISDKNLIFFFLIKKRKEKKNFFFQKNNNIDINQIYLISISIIYVKLDLKV